MPIPRQNLSSFPKRRRMKMSSIQEIRSMNSNDLICSSKWCLAFTAILLLYGLPFAATCVSAFGLMLFPFQTKSFYHLLKDLRKWVLLSAFAFVASFKCYMILELASNKQEDDESHAYLLWLSGTALHTIAGGFLTYCLYKDYLKEPDNNSQSTIQFLEVRVQILKGRKLVAKDHNIFGKPTTSDPYVKVLHNNKYVGETAIVWKTLNPEWEDELFCLPVVPKTLSRCNELELIILDRDKFSKDDNMGTVMVPIPNNLNRKVCNWYKVETGRTGPYYCPDPTGELQVEVEVRQLLSKRFKRQLTRKSSDRQLVVFSKQVLSPTTTTQKQEQQEQQQQMMIEIDPATPAKSARKKLLFGTTPPLSPSPQEDDLTSQATDEINSLNSSSSSSLIRGATTAAGTPNRRKAILFSPSKTKKKKDSSTSTSTTRLSYSKLAKKLPRISLSPKRDGSNGKRKTVKGGDNNKIPRPLQ